MTSRPLSTVGTAIRDGVCWAAVLLNPFTVDTLARASTPLSICGTVAIRGDRSATCSPQDQVSADGAERLATDRGSYTHDENVPEKRLDLTALGVREGRVLAGQERFGTGRIARGPAKKLVEFGWDEPDTAFLRTHRDQFERSPFDGCVFHVAATSSTGRPENFSWLGWGRRKFSRDELAPAFDDLKALALASTRFRHSFLRFNVTPADLDWFEDQGALLSNALLAAQLARAGGIRGILFDTEAYQGKLFDYRKQRDIQHRSWDDYAAQVRRRGREVMTAFQDGFPELTVLVTFGPSLVWRQSEARKKPLRDCADGLLVPFFDGLIEASKGKTQLVDGYELSYGFRDPDAFGQAREAIKLRAGGLAAEPLSYRKVVSAAFGLWLDYDWRKHGWNLADLEKNHFSPDRFETSLRAALAQSDEIVWIYCETPRWWTETGVTASLPSAYVDAIRRVRRELVDD